MKYKYIEKKPVSIILPCNCVHFNQGEVGVVIKDIGSSHAYGLHTKYLKCYFGVSLLQ